MNDMLSGCKLRMAAAKAVQAQLDEHHVTKPAGTISDAQLKDYIDHGLVEPATDGRWPPDAVEQLARAHALGRPDLKPHARSLDRRVLLRFTENTKAISPRTLKEALLAVLPTIAEAVRKMKRINTLINQWHAVESDPDLRMRSPNESPRRKTPARHSWAQLVENTPDDLLFNAAEVQLIHYGHNLAYLEAEVGPPNPKAPRVADLPPEERLALLTVRALARHQATVDTTAPEGSAAT